MVRFCAFRLVSRDMSMPLTDAAARRMVCAITVLCLVAVGVLPSRLDAAAASNPRRSCASFTYTFTPARVGSTELTVRITKLRTYLVSCREARKVIRAFYPIAGGGSAERRVRGLTCAGYGNERIMCDDVERVVRWVQRVR
jgi:hypothetical protein